MPQLPLNICMAFPYVLCNNPEKTQTESSSKSGFWTNGFNLTGFVVLKQRSNVGSWSSRVYDLGWSKAYLGMQLPQLLDHLNKKQDFWEVASFEFLSQETRLCIKVQPVVFLQGTVPGAREWHHTFQTFIGIESFRVYNSRWANTASSFLWNS